MIRASSIKKLCEEVVINKINSILVNNGFKYFKSKGIFKKTSDIFEQIVRVGTQHSPLIYDEENEELKLKFTFSSSIESAQLEKWATKELGIKSRLYHPIHNIHCIENVDFTLLNEGDFFTPTESQKFKSFVTSSLIGPDNQKRISLNELIEQLETIFKELNQHSNSEYLWAHRKGNYHSYIDLLVFSEHKELAEKALNEEYQTLCDYIEQHMSHDVDSAKRGIQELEGLIRRAKNLLGLDLTNPYSRSFSISRNLLQKIKLSPKLGYNEKLRLDLSFVDLTAFSVNDEGLILLVVDRKKILLIDSSGKLLKEHIIEYPKGFDYPNTYEVRWLNEIKSFVCNNYIIRTDDFEVIELPFNIDTSKYKNRNIYSTLKDLVYDNSSKEFITLFTADFKESILSFYDLKGNLKSSLIINGNSYKINLNRKEIFVLGQKNSFDILTFKGKPVRNIKYGNGNERIAISPDGKKIVLHFYSSKSQLFDFEKNKEQTLWAHPTFLKGYKEKFYNDINHNFGMTVAEFSPDGKYVIGGADHGKYVAWDVDKFERIEMIPNQDSLNKFNWFTTSVSNGQSRKNYFKPYVIEYEGKELFINRGYCTSKIWFIRDSKYIVTQNSDCLIVWDNHYNNVGFVSEVGQVFLSDNDYILAKQDKELILFQRQKDFDNNFETSVFKENIEENSNIQHIKTPELKDESEPIKTKIQASPNPEDVKKEPEKKGFLARLLGKTAPNTRS